MSRRWYRSRMLTWLVAAALGMSGLTGASPVHADVITVSNDQGRTGWDQSEPNLSPGAVDGSDFGQLFSTALTGQIYAQPLVVGSTVIAATEENHVYGLDSETGAIKWSTYLGPSWPASTVGCGDLTPDIGATSTPVYDPASGDLYLTAKVDDGANATVPHYYLYALNAGTGAVVPGWPVAVQGSPSNDPTNTFDTEDQLQRTGLLLQNGSVYMGFGSLCDVLPFRGYVAGVNTTTRAQHLWTAEAGPNASGGGTWQAGGGIVSDGGDGMFIATGNGVTPPTGPGTSPPATLSESVVHLTAAADGTLSANDFFAPSDAGTLDANDQDLASGGPVALPDAEFGTSADPHLMVEIGKAGELYLLNRDSLGGRGQGADGGDQVLGETLLTGVWGHPAVWGGDGGYVYLTESQGYLTALGYGLTSSGAPALHLAGNSAATFGYSSGSPVVTSDGTTSGSALVWDIQSSGSDGTGGQLMVYNAVPSHRQLTLLRAWPLGTVSKFSVPATNHGRVYVGTRDGNLMAFGAPINQALQSGPVHFGDTAVGSTGSATATLTATRTVTVSAISAAAPFAVAPSAPPALPVTLTTGQTLTVPVTFSPTTWGADTGQIQLTTDEGTIYVGLDATATQPGLAATPPSLDYGHRAVGSRETLALSVENTGTTTETFTSLSAPSAPFTAVGLPKAGDTLAAGATDTFTVAYTPSAVGNDDSSVVLTTDQGSATIPLTGVAQIADDQVTISPTTVSLGSVNVSQTSAPGSFTVTNTGNLTLTITKAAPPTAPFTVLNPIPEGQQLAPGESYTVSMVFSPYQLANFTGTYVIGTDTGQGEMHVTVTGTGTPTPAIPVPPPGGGWTVNGSARMAGTNLALTTRHPHDAGSAVYGTPVPSAGLRADFTARLNGGDGLTFSLLDAAKSKATSLGRADGGMGFSGLKGLAVVLGTHREKGAPSDNFVGIATGARDGSLTYLATSTRIPALRTGTHTVTVQVTGDQLDVSVDGKLVLSPTVTLPAEVLPAFTAATGATADEHVVSGATIAAGGASLPPPGGGWSYNGAGALNGPDTLLSHTGHDQAGTVTYPTPLGVHAMELEFTSVIGGKAAGQGLTFSLFDAASVTPGAVGDRGDGLGASGLPGVYLILNTDTGGKAASSVAIGTNPASGTAPKLLYSSANLPSLLGTHTVWVMYFGGLLSIAIDGTLVLQGTVTVPATALPSFTAGTGQGADAHSVRDVSILYF